MDQYESGWPMDIANNQIIERTHTFVSYKFPVLFPFILSPININANQIKSDIYFLHWYSPFFFFVCHAIALQKKILRRSAILYEIQSILWTVRYICMFVTYFRIVLLREFFYLLFFVVENFIIFIYICHRWTALVLRNCFVVLFFCSFWTQWYLSLFVLDSGTCDIGYVTSFPFVE